jgi:hypothetical protein
VGTRVSVAELDIVDCSSLTFCRHGRLVHLCVKIQKLEGAPGCLMSQYFLRVDLNFLFPMTSGWFMFHSPRAFYAQAGMSDQQRDVE